MYRRRHRGRQAIAPMKPSENLRIDLAESHEVSFARLLGGGSLGLASTSTLFGTGFAVVASVIIAAIVAVLVFRRDLARGCPGSRRLLARQQVFSAHVDHNIMGCHRHLLSRNDPGVRPLPHVVQELRKCRSGTVVLTELSNVDHYLYVAVTTEPLALLKNPGLERRPHVAICTQHPLATSSYR